MVENAYVNEKEDACSALAELALNTGYGVYTDVGSVILVVQHCCLFFVYFLCFISRIHRISSKT